MPDVQKRRFMGRDIGKTRLEPTQIGKQLSEPVAPHFGVGDVDIRVEQNIHEDTLQLHAESRSRFLLRPPNGNENVG
jgi:hypothetical protein